MKTEAQKQAERERVKAYYHANKEARKKATKEYRQANKEKYREYSRQKREKITDTYAKWRAARKFGLTASEINEMPEVADAWRLTVTIKRKLKEHGTKQINRPEQPLVRAA